MKKLILPLILLLGICSIGGCYNPFRVDPAAQERATLDRRLADQDAKLAAAEAALQKVAAEAKATGNADLLAAAQAIATSVSEIRAERAQTQAQRDALPKAHIDVDTLLSIGETGAGIAGLGWVALLFKAGRKAKALADEYQEKHLSAQSDLDSLKGNWKAAIAGIEGYAATLAPEAKRALYSALQAAAKEHAEDPGEMARMVAITKADLRGGL